MCLWGVVRYNVRRADANRSSSSHSDGDAHTMLIPIRLQINIQFNFLTITNHGRSRERRKAAKPEASAGQAKLRKPHSRPIEDVQSRSGYHSVIELNSVLTDCRREASEERPMLVEGQRVTTCNRSLACMLQQHSEPHLEDVFGQRHRSSLQGKRGVVNVETMTERKVLTMKDVYQ
ncbi:hypothetical protein FOMPIDRAFT_93497 [Fomitopsis schrenkii]|uniref:Uncharacterized protein n=1 Tax=Fomitopsis schrenkii TaxID=2126942 RepID=S8F7P4_FOMSC|nr:hypothetical protein FOMPIDRAFT_93497 [Fomitopsis schrenkii]